MDHLAAVDEVELGQGEDPVAVERGLEAEVEAGERLDGRQPGHHQRRLDPAVLAQREFLGEQAVDRLERGDLAPLELAHDGIERSPAPAACCRPTRLRLMRSRTEGTSSGCAVITRCPSPASRPADRLVEVERAAGNEVAGAAQDNRRLRRARRA